MSHKVQPIFKSLIYSLGLVLCAYLGYQRGYNTCNYVSKERINKERKENRDKATKKYFWNDAGDIQLEITETNFYIESVDGGHIVIGGRNHKEATAAELEEYRKKHATGN